MESGLSPFSRFSFFLYFVVDFKWETRRGGVNPSLRALVLCIFMEGNLRRGCIGAVVEKQQGTSVIRLGRMAGLACRRPS